MDKLQRPLTPGSADSLMASANYSKAVHHVLDIIHEVLHHQRQLENIWQHRKVRLHQRLQLCVFQQDVQQVRHKITPAAGFVLCSWASSYRDILRFLFLFNCFQQHFTSVFEGWLKSNVCACPVKISDCAAVQSHQSLCYRLGFHG